MMTIIGFPPAGGCTTLSNIMKKIPTPTAIAILMNIGNGIKFTKIKPTNVVTKCPKKTLRGRANGLSGNPNNKTIDDPNDPAKNKPKALLYVRTVNTPIVNAEKKPAIRAFLKISLFNLIIKRLVDSSYRKK